MLQPAQTENQSEQMKILVTAGNTQTPIDRVRCLTNIFSGRTGGRLAVEGYRLGKEVTLLTSHLEVIADLAGGESFDPVRWRVRPYRKYDDLAKLLEEEVSGERYDAIIHAAAVSDYALAGVFAPGENGALVDVAAGKVKSHFPELWLRLTPTPKLVDNFRSPWGFCGRLVKFKLEVGLSEAELEAVAEGSRRQSEADLMVANTLEGMHDWALLGPVGGRYEKVTRADLPRRVFEELRRIG